MAEKAEPLGETRGLIKVGTHSPTASAPTSPSMAQITVGYYLHMRSDTHRSVRAPIDAEALSAARATALGSSVIGLLADSFRMLADPTRLRLLHSLGTGPLCVRDLALLAGVSESATSHQLRLLRDRGLVTTRRAGTIIYYSLSDHHLPTLLREAEYHADHVRRDIPDHSYPAADTPRPAVRLLETNEAAG